MEILETVVVDDNPKARNHLVEVLNKMPEVNITGICEDGLEAIRVINATSPQLIFLDIEMPDMDGFQVVSSIEVNPSPSIVFVTTDDRYASRAFEVQATDFIHKPCDVSRIAQAVERTKTMFAHRFKGVHGEKHSPDPGKDRRKRTRFILKEAEDYFVLRSENIRYIKADGNYLTFYTDEGKHLVRHTLSDMEKKLDSERFFRISRSSIVNIEVVDRIEKQSYGNYMVHLNTGSTLKMSKSYSRLLDQFTHL